jgi:hypothetical protein
MFGHSAAFSGGVACPVAGQPGIYSKLSTFLCFQDFETGQRHLGIASPDGLVQYVIDGEDGRFYVRGRPTGQQLMVGNDGEIIWSPDSKAIIRTNSFGAAGPTIADVEYIETKRADRSLDITGEIRQSFATRYRGVECAHNVNVAGLGWERGSTEALFVAQIAPIPDCGTDWGYFDVYVVAVPQAKILRIYPMAVAIRRFGNLLGSGLRRQVPRLR